MKQNLRNKFSLLSFIISTLSIILIGICIYFGLNEYMEYKVNRIRNNEGITMGTIEDKHPYKGKDVTVTYFIKGVKYEERKGVSNDFFRKVEIGTKVLIKYDTTYPSYFIIEE